MGASRQRGYVTPRGKKWYGYFRKTVNDPTTGEQKTLRVPVILGPRSQMKRSEAREALEREITKQNGHTGGDRVMNDGAATFGWFVRNRFLPLKEAHWKEETSKVKKLLIQRDLIDPFDRVPLENFNFRAPGAARLEGTDVVTAVPVCNSRWIPEGRDRMSLFLVSFPLCRMPTFARRGQRGGVGTSTATFRDFPIGNNRLLLESVEGAWVGRYLNDLLWLLAAEPKELIECM